MALESLHHNFPRRARMFLNKDFKHCFFLLLNVFYIWNLVHHRIWNVKVLNKVFPTMKTFKGFPEIVGSQPWICTNNNSKQNRSETNAGCLTATHEFKFWIWPMRNESNMSCTSLWNNNFVHEYFIRSILWPKRKFNPWIMSECWTFLQYSKHFQDSTASLTTIATHWPIIMAVWSLIKSKGPNFCAAHKLSKLA